MSSAALLALQNAINTNTLTAAMQAALSTALDVIIPTFPTPDELSNSIPPTEAELAREWIAVLYTIQAEGGGGTPVPPTFGTLIEPNAAALTAVDVSSLLNGQPAVVETFGAMFNLQPIGSLVVDGVTVLASSDPTRVWERGDSVIIETARAQQDWFISSAGSDEATGVDAGHAIKTNAEVYRRWGNTWEPNLTGASTFTVHHLTPSIDGSDPAWYAPLLEDGATFVQIAPLPAASFVGTLNAVTAKNRATNQALEATFTTTSGAIVSSMVLVNATRGDSRAMAVTDVGAGVWLLTQPLTAYTGGFPASSEVDTWANGDAIQGFAMVRVDVARLGARAATLSGSASPAHLVQDIAIIDGNNFGGSLTVDSSFATLEDVPCGRPMQPTAASLVIAENASFPTSVQAAVNGALQFAGGFVGTVGIGSNITSNMGGSSLFIDTVLLGNVTVQDAPTLDVYVHMGSVLIASGLHAFGAIYGPGTCNVLNGSLSTNGSAAATLPIAVKQLNSVPTGYSRVTGATVTVHGGIPLTTANLDAAAGAAGFGGYAEGGGSFISLVNGVQP